MRACVIKGCLVRAIAGSLKCREHKNIKVSTVESAKTGKSKKPRYGVDDILAEDREYIADFCQSPDTLTTDKPKQLAASSGVEILLYDDPLEKQDAKSQELGQYIEERAEACGAALESNRAAWESTFATAPMHQEAKSFDNLVDANIEDPALYDVKRKQAPEYLSKEKADEIAKSQVPTVRIPNCSVCGFPVGSLMCQAALHGPTKSRKDKQAPKAVCDGNVIEPEKSQISTAPRPICKICRNPQTGYYCAHLPGCVAECKTMRHAPNCQRVDPHNAQRIADNGKCVVEGCPKGAANNVGECYDHWKTDGAAPSTWVPSPILTKVDGYTLEPTEVAEFISTGEGWKKVERQDHSKASADHLLIEAALIYLTECLDEINLGQYGNVDVKKFKRAVDLLKIMVGAE